MTVMQFMMGHVVDHHMVPLVVGFMRKQHMDHMVDPFMMVHRDLRHVKMVNPFMLVHS
jgi:hypothetical protein